MIHELCTLGQYWEIITAVLPSYGVNLDNFDYASTIVSLSRDTAFPQGYHWEICYTLRGDSEGWYIYTAVVYARQREKVSETLFRAKTFVGWEVANVLWRR